MRLTKEIFKSDRNNLLLAAAIAALVVLPILFYGVPYGYDMPHHYQCALTYLDAIKSGDFYPSWTLARNLGYGALELRMYPPISHYVLAIFQLIFNDWHLATWANYSFWWILGSLGIYLLAREFFSPQSALFASALFSVMPYRLSQLYLTFLYAELCAITILPFCFLFLTRILKENDSPENSQDFDFKRLFCGNILGFGISYAALILTHLPMTVIGTFGLGIYFLTTVRWNYKAFQTSLLKTICGLSIGLVSTSFFWLKVLQEKSLMAKNLIYDEVHVHYEYNFLLTLLQSYNDVSYEVYESVSLVYDLILLVTLLIVVPTASLSFFRKTSSDHSLRGIFWTLFTTISLTTILSKPLWDNLPVLSEVQFPWRFMGVISIFAPIAAAAGFNYLVNLFQKNEYRPFGLIIVGIICIGCFFGINQSIRGAVYKDSIEMNVYVSNAAQKEGFSFWWTKFARKEMLDDTEKVSSENREIEITDWQADHRAFRVAQGNPSDVRVATFYHPNWQAEINGISAQISPSENGAMLISVPSEASVINLNFKENRIVQFGRWLSGILWFFIILAMPANLRRKNFNSCD